MENLRANCPICSANITISPDTQESEIITCPECHNRILVVKIDENGATLEQAPEIEEDWGE